MGLRPFAHNFSQDSGVLKLCAMILYIFLNPKPIICSNSLSTCCLCWLSLSHYFLQLLIWHKFLNEISILFPNPGDFRWDLVCTYIERREILLILYLTLLIFPGILFIFDPELIFCSGILSILYFGLVIGSCESWILNFYFVVRPCGCWAPFLPRHMLIDCPDQKSI